MDGCEPMLACHLHTLAPTNVGIPLAYMGHLAWGVHAWGLGLRPGMYRAYGWMARQLHGGIGIRVAYHPIPSIGIQDWIGTVWSGMGGGGARSPSLPR